MRQFTRRELLKTATAGTGTLAFSGGAHAQQGKSRVRVAAVQMHATLGEVCDTLRDVFGVHRPGKSL